MTRIIGRSDAAGNRSTLPRSWRGATQYGDWGDGSSHGRAAEILLAARAQARSLIENAEAHILATLDQTRQQGWEQGYAAGLEQARHEHAGVIQQLAALVAVAAQDEMASTRRLDATVLSLVFAMNRAILRREPALAPETVLHVARAALSELSAEQEVVLRVHPNDEAFLMAQLSNLGLPASVTVRVVADSGISQGGCMIESGPGRVDATLERQVERLEALLNEQINAS